MYGVTLIKYTDNDNFNQGGPTIYFSKQDISEVIRDIYIVLRGNLQFKTHLHNFSFIVNF